MHITDQKLETVIGRTLQIGVLLAALVVLFGGILYLRQTPATAPDYKHFHGVSNQLNSPLAIAKLAAKGNAQGLIQLGLLILIATPIFRVAVAGVGFLLERDQMYVWVSLAVLAILIYSLWHSH